MSDPGQSGVFECPDARPVTNWDRIVLKFTSGRFLVLMIVVLTVCIGTLWLRVEPWLKLLEYIVVASVTHYFSRAAPNSTQPKEGK
jgi:hypothetical protein